MMPFLIKNYLILFLKKQVKNKYKNVSWSFNLVKTNKRLQDSFFKISQKSVLASNKYYLLNFHNFLRFFWGLRLMSFVSYKPLVPADYYYNFCFLQYFFAFHG